MCCHCLGNVCSVGNVSGGGDMNIEQHAQRVWVQCSACGMQSVRGGNAALCRSHTRMRTPGLHCGIGQSKLERKIKTRNNGLQTRRGGPTATACRTERGK